MTEVDDNIKYGMIEAISHLIHRDYDAIVKVRRSNMGRYRGEVPGVFTSSLHHVRPTPTSVEEQAAAVDVVILDPAHPPHVSTGLRDSGLYPRGHRPAAHPASVS